MVAGRGGGKTGCWAVPRVLAAAGPVVVVSPYGDVVEATCGVRGRVGRVLVVDPEGLLGAGQGVWWDPVAWATSLRRAGVVARALVGVAGLGRPAPQRLRAAAVAGLAGLLAAACRRGLGLEEVLGWCRDGAGQVVGVPEGWSEARGLAREAVGLLVGDEALRRWVTPQEGLPGLRVGELVGSTDTVYCLNRGGAEGVGALAAVLVAAVVEEAGPGPSGGPVLVELDDAGRVCPWEGLPGAVAAGGGFLVVDVLVGSWLQGEAVWGPAGMRRMWESAGTAALGAGSCQPVVPGAMAEVLAGSGLVAGRADPGVPGWFWVVERGGRPALVEVEPYWRRQERSRRARWLPGRGGSPVLPGGHGGGLS